MEGVQVINPQDSVVCIVSSLCLLGLVNTSFESTGMSGCDCQVKRALLPFWVGLVVQICR